MTEYEKALDLAETNLKTALAMVQAQKAGLEFMKNPLGSLMGINPLPGSALGSGSWNGFTWIPGLSSNTSG
jgi:hypothetical protein